MSSSGPGRRGSRPTPSDDLLRFRCPCGAALRIPASRAGGHGVCPKCRRRLLLNVRKLAGRREVAPSELGSADPSGNTFLLEAPYRIEDHFREIPDAPAKVSFRCPCSRRLAVPARLVDRRVRCPHCGARLLLVGKSHPRTHKLEIHPLVVEEPPSGDTMVLDG
jgi:DNA-directed RNA polymerase subunit RPC12/RpoP